MKEKIKKLFKVDLKTQNAGIVEYVFATIAVICALPSVIVYLILNLLIMRSVKALVKKVWK